VKTFESEGGPGTVAQEALNARPVVASDANGGVDTEAAGALADREAGSQEGPGVAPGRRYATLRLRPKDADCGPGGLHA